MKLKSSWVIRALCLWTFFVFGVLIKNMITDDEHELAFRLVHSAISAVSIALAAVVWPLAKRADGS